MQWHWGNIGSAVAGLAALLAAIFAVYGVIMYGPAWLRDSRARQKAQAAAADAQADLAREQASQIRLERRRAVHGWSPGGWDTFSVALVTSAHEMDVARAQLTGAGGSTYVILEVTPRDDDLTLDGLPGAAVGHAGRLRKIIESDCLISRAPTRGEREAIEAGCDALGIPRDKSVK